MLKSNLLKACLLTPAIVFCLSLNGVFADPCPDCPPNMSTIQGAVEYPASWLLKWDPNNPQQINRNSSVEVNVIGGRPLYTWSVSGIGFWFDAAYTQTEIVTDTRTVTLYADDTACGAATISVTDLHEDTVNGSIRGSSGRWVLIGSTCQVPGPATNYLGYSQYHGWQYERIVDKYRQSQYYRIGGYFYGTCLWEEPPCGNQYYSCYPASNPGEECITLESTGRMDGYDRKEFPCVWQSPEAWSEANDDYNTYCSDLGALGWTSMQCLSSNNLRIEEWQCQ